MTITFTDTNLDNNVVHCKLRYKDSFIDISYPLNFISFDTDNFDWFFILYDKFTDLMLKEHKVDNVRLSELNYAFLYNVIYPLQEIGHKLVSYELMYQLGVYSNSLGNQNND
jgi:hypothetical protein